MRPSLVLAGLFVAGAACGSRTGILASDYVGGENPGAACGDGGAPARVYAMDGPGGLYEVDPRAGSTRFVGAPDCGDGSIPWTMTLSPTKAYVVYTDWTLYAVDLGTLACSRVPIDLGPLGIQDEFGVAVSQTAAGERLFVYGLTQASPVPILAQADTTSFVLSKVGDLHPAPPQSTFPVNLTADAFGHLYAYSPSGYVQEIDPATASVLRAEDTGVTTTSTWATIAYGKNLYLWSGSLLVGYDLTAGKRTSEVDLKVAAIGAGSFPLCSL